MNDLSRIERHVAELPDGSALTCTRADLYDPLAGLFYSPLQFRQEAMPTGSRAKRPLPTDEWVEQAFLSLVRQEFRRGATISADLPTTSPVATKNCDAADVFRSARDQIERHIYGPQLEKALNASRGEPLEIRLYRLLGLPLYMGKSLGQYFSEQAFTELLSSRADLSVGIRILVPALPFRDQNPFRTTDPAHAVTLSEVLFLLRLHAIVLAIFQVVPTGSHCIIVADGTAYAEALGVPMDEARRYVESLRSVRSALNLQRSVSIIDLRELMRGHAVGDDGKPLSEVVEASIVDALQRLQESGRCDDAFSNLEAGIRWNLNLIDHCDSSEKRSRTWRWLSTPVGTTDPEFTELDAHSHKASIDYAAINLSEKFLGTMSARLPGCIRATTHPKPEQIPIPRRGSVSAWNGVAHTHHGGSLLDCNSDPLFRLSARPLTAHIDRDYLDGTVYYTYEMEA